MYRYFLSPLQRMARCKVDLKCWVSFSKPFSLMGHLTKENNCTSLYSAPWPLSSDSSGEMGAGFCVMSTCELRPWWLDCIYITLRSDHNASSTTSGPGHWSDNILIRSAFTLVFSMCMWRHPDTGRMLMASVNAAKINYCSRLKDVLYL